MKYLVTYSMGEPKNPADYSGYNSEVSLKNMNELRDFILLLPETWKILNMKQIPIYDTLQDFKAEILKLKNTNIEMGKISQSLDN